MTKDTISLSPMVTEVMNGLRSANKWLPSKYFYDERGDQLFQQIMHLDEYYLTRKELEIFNMHKQAILSSIDDGQPFRIIELGAGDGLKTKVLLRYFLEAGADFAYTPVDISGNVLEILEDTLKSELPELRIEAYQGDYFEALARIADSPEKDIVFFLGSNIGNFVHQQAEEFLSQLQQFLKPGDLLFMGVDLKKDPSVILNAYNDKQGVTREFNLNLLDRINAELGADFNRETFLHYPYYNPHTGECRSYLISMVKQEVTINEEVIHFDAWEAIFMEVSKKYDQGQLKNLAIATHFVVRETFQDHEEWFADVLWEKG